ncbi:MAG TPA: hypothetical protein VGI40_14630 [Pirellulaceae bacterium]
MKKPGPFLETGTFDDFLKCRAQVAIPPAALSHCRLAELFVDDVNGLVGRTLERSSQVFVQFWEQRDRPRGLAFMVLGLGRLDLDQVVFPVHIFPAERQHFAGAPQTAVAAQRHDHPPIVVGTSVQQGLRIVARDEVHLVRHRPRDRNFIERVFGDEPLAFRRLEPRLGPLQPLTNRKIGQPLGNHRLLIVVRIARRNAYQIAVSPELVD